MLSKNEKTVVIIVLLIEIISMFLFAGCTTNNVDDNGEKTLIYGTLSLSQEAYDRIVAFNKANNGVKIEVKEYGYDGKNKLDAEIVSGKGPDIIDLSGLDVSPYISKNVLCDLYQFIDGDEDLNRKNFVDTVLTYYEEGAYLYGISVGFYLETLMGRTSQVGTNIGWSISDVQNLMERVPYGTEFIHNLKPEGMLRILLCLGVDSYIDWEKGTCFFESESFVNLLKFANGFNSDLSSQESVYSKISSNKLILNRLYLYDVQEYVVSAALFGGDEVICIGYPGAESGGAIMYPYLPMAISVNSKCPEESWRFVRTFLLPDYQIHGLHYNFPINMTALNYMFDEAMRGMTGTYSMPDFKYTLSAASQKDIDTIWETISTAHGSYLSGETIVNIIIEESLAYFNGDRTVYDTARIIQNRMQIYMDVLK